ncbi:MAG: ATP-binding protein, partial [Lachnospiraceae bacterium]
AFVADSGYMYRICQNLMENALKYSAAHTRIFLKTEVVIREGKLQVQLEITNTADYRMNFTKEQIVERFARGDEARSTDGNGLGLAIVSTYTSALGGWFDVNIDCDQFKAIVEFPK